MVRFSQNFLHDTKIRDRIIDASEISSEDTLLEIGPGKGFLTEALLQKTSKVIAIEKDERLIPELKRHFPKLTLYFDDALTFPLETISFDKIIANIPYHITKPLLSKLAENCKQFSYAALMVQKEVAEKLAAKFPSTAHTAYIQYIFRIEYLFIVPAKCFSPVPLVDSAIILLKKANRKPLPEKFFGLLNHAFTQKRKKIASSLKKYYEMNLIIKTLRTLSLNENARPSELTVEDWMRFFSSIEKDLRKNL